MLLFSIVSIFRFCKTKRRSYHSIMFLHRWTGYYSLVLSVQEMEAYLLDLLLRPSLHSCGTFLYNLEGHTSVFGKEICGVRDEEIVTKGS